MRMIYKCFRITLPRWTASRIVRFSACVVCLYFVPSMLAQTSEGGSDDSKQEVKPKLPSGPLLNPAPDFSEWSISFSYAEDRKVPGKPPVSSAPVRQRRSDTTRTHDLIHEVVTDTAAKQSETWFTSQAQYIKPPGESVWRVSSNDAASARHDLYHTDSLPPSGFRKLDWIKPQNYAGAINAKGTGTILIFVPSGSSKLDLRSNADLKILLDSQQTIACINAENRLPIIVKSENVISVYQFGPPPSDMQTLPLDLAQQVKRGEEARTRLGAPAMRPY